MKNLLIVSFSILISFSALGQNGKTMFYEVPMPIELNAKESSLYESILKNQTTIKVCFIQFDDNFLFTEGSSFNFLGNTFFTSQIRYVKRDSANYSIFSKIKNKSGHIVLTISKDDILGNILIENDYFEIKTIGKGKFILRKYEQKNYPKESCSHFIESSERRDITIPQNQLPIDDGSISYKVEQTETTPLEICNLRVLIMYTPAVSSSVNDPRNLCQQAVDIMNLTFINSNIGHVVELAYCSEVSYVESNNNEQDLNRFSTENDGFMDEVFKIRNDLSADVCIILTTSSSYCGIAKAIYATKATTFCQVNYDCAVNNLSFPHEIGHLLGARHDSNSDPTNTPFGDGHGYSYSTGGWRTIMATYNSCCVRLPNWSNPSVTYNNNPTGILNSSNNSRVLNTTIIDTRVFRKPPKDILIPSFTNYTIKNFSDYVAEETISTSSAYGNVVFGSSSISFLKAGKSITLNPNFSTNGLFIAEIRSINECYGDSTAGGPDNGGSDSDYSFSDSNHSIRLNPNFDVYPNPSNGEVSIRYWTTIKSVNSISLLNALGGKVEVLLESTEEDIGEHSIRTNLTNKASGLYLVKLKTGEKEYFKKITIK